MKSRAAVLVGASQLEVQEIEVPRLRADEALLRIEACGLCGSDIEQFKGQLAGRDVGFPVIPGHEIIGVIEEIGPQAQQNWRLRPGDRVAVDPNLFCGKCSYCLSGVQYHCQSVIEGRKTAYGLMTMSGRDGLWGGYSQYLHLQPNTILHRIPREMPTELASMFQILAAGVRWAVEIPQTSIGDRVLILGCGQRGLGSVVACKEAGADTIIVTGLASDAHKLDLALSLGATHAIVADQDDVVARVMEITQGQGVDVVVDVVPGATHPTVQAVDVVVKGGTVVLAGIKDRAASFDINKLITREIRLQGAYCQTNDAYRQAIQMLSRNKYDLGRLHTHAFDLDHAEEAIHTLSGALPDRRAINVSIVPSGFV